MSGFTFVPKRVSDLPELPPIGRRLRFHPEGIEVGEPVTLTATDGTTFAYPCGAMADVVAHGEDGETLIVDTYEGDDDAPHGCIVRRCELPTDALLTLRGRPYVPGDDERRNIAPPKAPPVLGKAGRAMPAVPVTPVTPAAPTVPDDAAEVLRKLGEMLAKPAAPATPAIDEDAVRELVGDRIADELAPLAERIDGVEADVADAVKRMDAVDGKLVDVLDALATATPAVRARVRTALAPSKASGNAIVDALSRWYAIGVDRDVNAMLLSPPSLGKSYAVREFGRGYDLYLEHGCSEDASEIDTLLGSPVPDGAGGFVVVDGVLTQAVRSAAEGKSVLLFLDETLRLSRLAQEWLLAILTGRVNPDGSRSFVLRTRRVVAGGTLEVLTCPAANLHIVGAGNLGMSTPVEAFWSRFESVRFHFDPATVRSVATSVLAANGVTGPAADKLAAAYTTIVTESRMEVAKGTIRYPADIRMLARSAAVSEADAKAVATTLSGRLCDNMANWSADLGDTDPESKRVCDKWAASLLSLATSL